MQTSLQHSVLPSLLRRRAYFSATAELSSPAWCLLSTAASERLAPCPSQVKDVISCQQSSYGNHSAMFLRRCLPAIDVHTPHARLPMPLNVIKSAPLVYVTAPLMYVIAPLCCDSATSMTLLSSPGC